MSKAFKILHFCKIYLLEEYKKTTSRNSWFSNYWLGFSIISFFLEQKLQQRQHQRPLQD